VQQVPTICSRVLLGRGFERQENEGQSRVREDVEEGQVSIGGKRDDEDEEESCAVGYEHRDRGSAGTTAGSGGGTFEGNASDKGEGKGVGTRVEDD
jgi:hypothetical protein